MTQQPLTKERVRQLFGNVPVRSNRQSKLIDLHTSIRSHVKAGMWLHFAYSEGRPMAISNEIVRCFAGTSPGFTISTAGLVANQTALVSEGLAKKLVVSFAGENYPTPAPNRIIQEAINNSAVEIEHQSLLVLYQRLAAGALGLPFAVTRSWRGSSLEKNESLAWTPDPFSPGSDVPVVRPIAPDITFVHALAADSEGNLLLAPPFGEGEVAAFAARVGVIATVERIVPMDVISANAPLMKVPSHRVISISEAPLGCHPYGIYSPVTGVVPSYGEDTAYFMELRAATQSSVAFREWTKKWILDLNGHGQYLGRLGIDRVNSLRGKAVEGIWADELSDDVLSSVQCGSPSSNVEKMIIYAGRVLRGKVLDEGYRIVEAGVGFANLAAWLAVAKLRADLDTPVDLVAEIGLYGYLPKPGDPFIFSNRNLPSCKSMTGVEAILGLYVGGRYNNCVGIIGAAQVDPAGNINSTYSDSGKFLVGSGGANDICSAARDIVVITQQSKSRLVEKLPYITSPGHSVSTLVTDRGIFKKRGGRFVLTAVFPEAGRSTEDLVQEVRSSASWQVDVDGSVAALTEPEDEELLRLRLFDIRRDFLGPRADSPVQKDAK